MLAGPVRRLAGRSRGIDPRASRTGPGTTPADIRARLDLLDSRIHTDHVRDENGLRLGRNPRSIFPSFPFGPTCPSHHWDRRKRLLPRFLCSSTPQATPFCLRQRAPPTSSAVMAGSYGRASVTESSFPWDGVAPGQRGFRCVSMSFTEDQGVKPSPCISGVLCYRSAPARLPLQIGNLCEYRSPSYRRQFESDPSGSTDQRSWPIDPGHDL